MTEQARELLAAPDPESRRLGAQRIAEGSGALAVALLLQALGDDDWRVRKEAAIAAASVAPRDAVLAELAGALAERDNVGLRNAAVEALIHVGSDAVPLAVRALAELDADGKKLAVEVLGGVPDRQGARALAQALADDDVNVRAAAAEALGAASLAGDDARHAAIEALSLALAPGEPLHVRLAALRSLAQLEAELLWETLEPLMTDPVLRGPAIAAAGTIDDPAAVRALARFASDPSLAVARSALVALVDCLAGSARATTLGALVRGELLASPVAEERLRTMAGSAEDARVRGAALALLGLLRNTTDVPQLLRGLSDEEVAGRAELALEWFGHDALPSLLEEGTRSSPPLRAAALSLVPRLTERADAPTLEALRDALRDDDPDVKTAALQAIAVTGGAGELPVLAAHAVSADPRVASAAASALAAVASRHAAESRALAHTIAADSAAAVVGCLLRGAVAGAAKDDDVAFLRSALDHSDVRVRRAAVAALADIGGAVAAEVVERALADEDNDVVLAAVRALGAMQETERLLGLLEGVHDAAVVSAALLALGQASPDRAFDAARPLLSSADALVASSAVETVSHLSGERREDALFVALAHPDAGVVKEALVHLARDMSPRALAQVGLCLSSGSYEVRRFAAELLGGTNDAATHALLRGRLDRESDPDVREALAFALSPRPSRDEP